MRRSILMLLLLPTSIVTSAACGGPNYKDTCTKREQCFGGNDKDIAACTDIASAEEEIAEDVGCGSEYETQYECVANASTCRSTTGGMCMTDANCGNQGNAKCKGGMCVVNSYGTDPTAQGVCQAEKAAFQRCMQ